MSQVGVITITLPVAGGKETSYFMPVLSAVRCARPDSPLTTSAPIHYDDIVTRRGIEVAMDSIRFDPHRPERTVLLRREMYDEVSRPIICIRQTVANAVCDYVLAHWEELWF
jgi:hypothetical protein